MTEGMGKIMDFVATPLGAILPPVISRHAASVDLFFGFMVALSAVLVLGIAGCILYFLIKFRRGSDADRSRPKHSSVVLEAAWILIPLLIMTVIFLWGARLYLGMFGKPAGVETIYVTGKQWMWKIRHTQGAGEINALHVPLGKPVRLVLSSDDVIHSFFLPALRLKRDAVPGRFTSFWFKADREGEFPFFCAQFCGVDHSGMTGKLTVMLPEDYAAWLRGENPGGSLAQAGEKAFGKYGCGACHGNPEAVRAPPLEGLFGSQVPLQDGGSVLADESYLRESIYFPAKKIVAGYAPVMPTFAGVISEEEAMSLIAYIRSMGGPSPSPSENAAPGESP